MENINTKALNSLVESVTSYVKEQIKKAKFDVTGKCVIKEVLDGNNYVVRMGGTEYSVPCCTDQKFIVGDKVLILFIQGDKNRKYIIGRA